MNPPLPTELPTQLGPYVMGAVIGIGAAAVVVRARDDRLDAEVAVKLLRSADPEIKERFLREARLLRRVSHPAVVSVHDVGETADGRPFLVMDLARGSLADRMRSASSLPDDATLAVIVTALADGLGALHRAGIVHRDVKPANMLIMGDALSETEAIAGTLLEPAERLVVGDLGFARDQRRVNPGTTLLGGTPGFRAPEQLLIDGSPDARADVYAATAVLWALLTGQTPPGPETLPVAVQTAPPPWRDFLLTGMATDVESRFPDMAGWAGAARALLTGAAPSPAAARMLVVPAQTFPYKGLAAFQPSDAALFFGRNELVDELVARLAARPVLVVGGASGSGKSSAVRAGLIPRLAGGALPGSGDWPVCLMTPGEHPQEALSAALAEAVGQSPLLLVVDQFEELFTLTRDPAEQQEFLASLRALSAGAMPRARIVLAVRADFYAACAAEPWLAAAVNANQVLVPPMTRAELRSAIEGPARRVGLHLQDGLAERLLADTGGDPGALPLLAHALAETWRRREGDVLTLAGYQATGGVEGAVGRSAEEVWATVGPEDQPTARRLLLRLVHPGDGTPDTRRVLDASSLVARQRALLDRFAEARLVTIDADGARLAHEAVLRSWTRLTGWLTEERDGLRLGRRLEDAAATWEAADRHPDLLLHGLPLARAEEWAATQQGDLAEPVLRLLDASRTAAGAAAVAVAERARRSAKVRHRVMIGLIALTALAVVTSAVAAVGLSRARHDAGVARAADRAAAEQLSRALAASAQSLADTNPYLATAWAAEAVAGAAPAAAWDALVRARVALAGDRLVPLGEPVPAPDGLAVALRGAGDLVAVGRRDGNVLVWDLSRNAQVANLTLAPGATPADDQHKGVQNLAFTADGATLVAGSSNGTVQAWDVSPQGAGPARVLATPGAIVWAVAAAPSGSTVAAGTSSGQVLVLDAHSGNAVLPPLSSGVGDVQSLAFSGDGTRLLAGSGNGHVVEWSLPDGGTRWTIQAQGSRILDLTACQKCTPARFATVSSDGTAKLWDVETGQALPDGPFDNGASATPNGVRGAAFTADGNTLTVGGADGAVYSWSTDPAHRDRLTAHRDRVTGLAATADGLTVISLSDDQTVQAWTRAARPAPAARVAALDGSATGFALAPDARALAVGMADGTVRLLDPATGAERGRLAGGGAGVNAVIYLAPDRLVTGDAAGTLRLWDTAANRVLAEHDGAHQGPVQSLAASGSGANLRLISAGQDGWLHGWHADLSDARTSASVGDQVTDLAVGPSSGQVVATTRSGGVFRWLPGSGDPMRFAHLGDTAWATAADDRTIAVAGADERVSTWSWAGRSAPTASWSQGAQKGNGFAVTFVGGTVIAAGAGDGKLRLYDAGTGEPLGPALALGDAPVRRLVSGPDGTIWAVDNAGGVYRSDALVIAAACAAMGDSFLGREQAHLRATHAMPICG